MERDREPRRRGDLLAAARRRRRLRASRAGSVADRTTRPGPRPKGRDPGPGRRPVRRPPTPSCSSTASDLAQWRTAKDGSRRSGRSRTATWRSRQAPATSRRTQAFGDCQLHVEWGAAPPGRARARAAATAASSSWDRYEVQVLDSFENQTYPDGQAAALYGQYPPLVNASRPPGEWQTYDIVFHAPRFDGGASSRARARDRLPQRRAGPGRPRAEGPTAHKSRPHVPGPPRQAARSGSRTTATRCATGTSGCASCRTKRTRCR